jgi:uncharacterized protein YecT (DUF1311 family)
MRSVLSISPIMMFGALAVVPAYADTVTPIDCAKAASTVEINVCTDNAYQAADQDLNNAYGAALERVRARKQPKPYDTASYEAAFVAAQIAWTGYRDAQCKDLTAQEWSGGSGTTSAILSCMTEKTLARTKELNAPVP